MQCRMEERQSSLVKFGYYLKDLSLFNPKKPKKSFTANRQVCWEGNIL